ncbi:hypothetical protein niasHT_010225 [Heterodera trifolii]|uniref:MATH domain-containing protein n=1 Tax=Heterodera trifolii TaxID=157864 RepID=A0ABD2MDR6_9BILA
MRTPRTRTLTPSATIRPAPPALRQGARPPSPTVVAPPPPPGARPPPQKAQCVRLGRVRSHPSVRPTGDDDERRRPRPPPATTTARVPPPGARPPKGSERSSETVHIMGCQWKILAEIITKNDSDEKWMAFFLKCAPQTEDENWSRKCMATLRIVSQLSWLEDFSREFDEKRIFSAGTKYRGFTYFITFAELMDPSKGFYDKNEDKVTLAIDFSVEGEEFG